MPQVEQVVDASDSPSNFAHNIRLLPGHHVGPRADLLYRAKGRSQSEPPSVYLARMSMGLYGLRVPEPSHRPFAGKLDMPLVWPGTAPFVTRKQAEAGPAGAQDSDAGALMGK